MASKKRKNANVGASRSKISKPDAQNFDCFMIKANRSVLNIHVGVQDATKLRTGALVCPSAASLDHSSGLARIIAAAAGPEFRTFCDGYVKTNSRVTTSDAVVSPGYDSEADRIICTVTPCWNNYSDKNLARKDLAKSISNVLAVADSENQYSLVLPPLSAGHGHFPPETVAEEMVAAFEQFIHCYPFHLREVRIVDRAKSSFLDKLKDALASNPNFSSRLSKLGGVDEEVKWRPASSAACSSVLSEQNIGPGSNMMMNNQNDLGPNVIIAPAPVNDDQPSICDIDTETAEATTENESDVSTDAVTSTGECQSMVFLDKPQERSIIQNMTEQQKNAIICIKGSGDRAVNIGIIDKTAVLIIGDGPDVTWAQGQVYSLLLSAQIDSGKEDRYKQLKQRVTWFYGEQNGPAHECPPQMTARLEEARERGDTEIQMFSPSTNQSIVININEMRITNLSCSLYRIPVGELPRHWTNISDPTKPFSLVQIDREGIEIEKVLAQMHDRKTDLSKILKVERVQNHNLYLKYKVKKDEMTSLKGINTPEQILWHGCPLHVVDSICTHGFDRGYSGSTNASNYGKGVYFAVNSSYSVGATYSRPDALGNKRLFMCRVLTGDHTQGSSDMKVAPTKHGSVLYDSVVDNIKTPSMFIIFKDYQAYPEYLITLRQ